MKRAALARMKVSGSGTVEHEVDEAVPRVAGSFRPRWITVYAVDGRVTSAGTEVVMKPPTSAALPAAAKPGPGLRRRRVSAATELPGSTLTSSSTVECGPRLVAGSRLGPAP